MNRTISMMIGKGSVTHNSRKFNAENTNPERSHLNRIYIDEPIKDVYRKLFGEATKRYNEKQTRSDRRIDDYYEKIRTGKQEKLFHEVIFQIGNKDDTGVGTRNGEIAIAALDEYAHTFQKRNPSMYMFSTHLHLDEATPHLHIDFVPFITGSKRGLDTRVSLKAALAAQGFIGISRQETEWSKWVLSEKEELSRIMERHGIEWEKLGTKDEHLSVLNYKKEQRAKEVVALEERHDEIEKRLAVLEKKEDQIELNVRRYNEDAEWQLPEPIVGMTTKAYKAKIVVPFVEKLKKVICSLVARYLDIQSSMQKIKNQYYKAQDKAEGLLDRLMEATNENKQLREVARDFSRVKEAVGQDRIDQILERGKEPEARSEWGERTRDIRER